MAHKNGKNWAWHSVVYDISENLYLQFHRVHTQTHCLSVLLGVCCWVKWKSAVTTVDELNGVDITWKKMECTATNTTYLIFGWIELFFKRWIFLKWHSQSFSHLKQATTEKITSLIYVSSKSNNKIKVIIGKHKQNNHQFHSWLLFHRQKHVNISCDSCPFRPLVFFSLCLCKNKHTICPSFQCISCVWFVTCSESRTHWIYHVLQKEFI